MYFERFPKSEYILPGTKTFKQVSDLFRRVKIKDKIRDEASLYSEYFVTNGERPEQIAHKHFGSAELHWVVLITNNITDAYYEWPLSFSAFEEFVKDKYSNPDGIHHYEITQSSGPTTGSGPDDYSHKIEVNSTETGAQSVSNREFEQRLQDEKRSINLLNPTYLNAFIEEFNNLVRN